MSDTWAYHDWHQSGNGDVASVPAGASAEFGEPANLADFERKAQMLDYVDHRAIFEGFNAHLWDPQWAPDVDDAAGMAEHDVADFQF